MIHIKLANKKNVNIMLTSLAVSACMIITSLACGNMAYGAEAPAGDDNFNYNGYSATQLKKISECISGAVPESECPAYEASSKDYYTDKIGGYEASSKDYDEIGGTVNHDNMPTGVISTKDGWLKWADAAMKANSYDGVYGTLRIASGGAAGATSSSTTSKVSDVRFRLIGINQDNRADGTGKAGLTFQAIGIYSMPSRWYDYEKCYDNHNDNNWNVSACMNIKDSNAGGWRDTMLRKDLNDESTGTIWNAIQSTDFKNNITPVLKITNNNADDKGNSHNTSNASSITSDKLWILSPSEMGMPIMRDYKIINGYYSVNPSDANVHYFDMNSLYKNTIKYKSSSDGDPYSYWITTFNYLYAGDAYQWWMLPAGSRKMKNGIQAYHNTDSLSYCNLSHPSFNGCNSSYSYWLRCAYNNSDSFSEYGQIGIDHFSAKGYMGNGVVLAFSF